MTVAQAIYQGSTTLSGPTARLDAELLLRHVLGISRIELYRLLFDELTEADVASYFKLIGRLATGEPLQYLTGHIEFYGLEFYVNPSILIPRPETELLVEKTLAIARSFSKPLIADIGCGSGAVAVTLARNLPGATIIALDISGAALDVARRNAERHGITNIEFVLSDLLTATDCRSIDIVCANLPYVPGVEAGSNRFEPQLALDGGEDGLAVIRRLVQQITARHDKPKWLLLEFGTGQAAAVRTIVEESLPGSRTDIYCDLIPLDRVSVTDLSII